MTEEMRKDPIDAERVKRAEGRMKKHEQEKEEANAQSSNGADEADTATIEGIHIGSARRQVWRPCPVWYLALQHLWYREFSY